ncbi:MAG: nucleotidyltransferase family protein, partial [Caldilineaceae bacterium]|nr:nucleotidyltransferase family protein [Caldilineaceae bacterium]
MLRAKALILAAGQGTRLRPLTDDCPKPMVAINGQPLLEYLVGWLKGHRIDEVAINLHYRPQVITDYFGDGSAFGVKIIYSYEDPILGTAGAARKLTTLFADGPFVVVYGDVLTDLDLSDLLAAHERNRQRDPSTAATISLMSVANPTEVGLVDVAADGKIRRFVEKPRADEVFTDLANAGVMVIEPFLLESIPPDTFYDFGLHLFPQLLAEDLSLYGWILPHHAYCLDIGTLEKYEQAQVDWQRRQLEPSLR